MSRSTRMMRATVDSLSGPRQSPRPGPQHRSPPPPPPHHHPCRLRRTPASSLQASHIIIHVTCHSEFQLFITCLDHSSYLLTYRAVLHATFFRIEW